jgi:hypothetical protein
MGRASFIWRGRVVTFKHAPNKSLDASGGCVFRNLRDVAEGALIRAAASTQPFGVYHLPRSIEGMATESEKTFYDLFVQRLRNNPVIAVGLVVFIIVLGVTTLAGNLNGLWEFTQSHLWGRSKAVRAEYCELVRPLVLELDRTKDAFGRWTQQDLSLESETLREGNMRARSILRDKGYLVPDSLREDQKKLIFHYDQWLEEYDRIRVRKTADPETLRVLALRSPFPKEAEQHFRERMVELEKILGSEPRCE